MYGRVQCEKYRGTTNRGQSSLKPAFSHFPNIQTAAALKLLSRLINTWHAHIPAHHALFVQVVAFATYQHWRWKAAGQWSQHSRSPPSRQLSQVSWLVALPLLRTSLTNFRLLFSTSSDFGGASSVWICCKSHQAVWSEIIANGAHCSSYKVEKSCPLFCFTQAFRKR